MVFCYIEDNMGFLKKLKKLQFWRRGKREKKGGSISENVNPNLVEHGNQVDTTNEAVDTNFLPHMEKDGAKKRVTFNENVEIFLVERIDEEVVVFCCIKVNKRFLRRLKKLIFRKKRGKRGKKDWSISENLATNFVEHGNKEDTRNEGEENCSEDEDTISFESIQE